MNKFLTALVTGLIAGSLSIGAFAADGVKPVKTPIVSVTTAKVAANKAVNSSASNEKVTGIKASVK